MSPSSPPAQRLLRNGLLALLYIALWSATWFMAVPFEAAPGISFLYLPAGLSLGALLAYGIRLWWLPALCMAAFSFTAWPDGRQVLANLLTSLLILGLYLFAVRRLRALGLHRRLRRLQDAVLLVVALPLIAALSALLGSLLFVSLGDLPAADLPTLWLAWSVGDAAGLLAMVPVVLSTLAPLARATGNGRRLQRESRLLWSNGWRALLAAALIAAVLLLASDALWRQTLLCLTLFALLLASALYGGHRLMHLLTAVCVITIGILATLLQARGLMDASQQGPLAALVLVVLLISLLLACGLREVRELVKWQQQRIERQVRDTRRQQAELRAVADASHDIILLFTPRGRLRLLSPSFSRITGFDTTRPTRALRELRRRVQRDDWLKLRSGLASAGNEPADTLRFVFRDAQDQKRWLEVSFAAVTDPDAPEILCIAREVTASENEKQWLLKLATHDPLTGVANRRGFFDVAYAEYARAIRYQRPLSVIMVDVDHFKRINDTWGHDAGDTALVELARVLRKELRSGESLARMGGEEFIVLLPETDLESALQAAERLRLAVREHVRLAADRSIVITASMGVAELHTDDADMHELLQRADEQLYRAKESGRDCVCGEADHDRQLPHTSPA